MLDIGDFELHGLALARVTRPERPAACDAAAGGDLFQQCPPAPPRQSTTSCMLLKREPSLSSMNVMPLESRRERTQPRRRDFTADV